MQVENLSSYPVELDKSGVLGVFLKNFIISISRNVDCQAERILSLT